MAVDVDLKMAEDENEFPRPTEGASAEAEAEEGGEKQLTTKPDQGAGKSSKKVSKAHPHTKHVIYS